MARPSTQLDAFSALAEPKRRQLLQTLAGRRMAVTQIIDELQWPQPMVSKHLAVLRRVKLVTVERQSRKKVYEMNAAPLKTVHDWTRQFEQLWDAHLLRIKARAEAKSHGTKSTSKPHDKEH